MSSCGDVVASAASKLSHKLTELNNQLKNKDEERERLKEIIETLQRQKQRNSYRSEHIQMANLRLRSAITQLRERTNLLKESNEASNRAIEEFWKEIQQDESAIMATKEQFKTILSQIQQEKQDTKALVDIKEVAKKRILELAGERDALNEEIKECDRILRRQHPELEEFKSASSAIIETAQTAII